MSLLNQSNLVATPVQEGDAGLILRKDGSWQIFNCHANMDPEKLTDRQREQGETLLAFAVALQLPEIMDILKKMANDPAIVGDAVIDYGVTN